MSSIFRLDRSDEPALTFDCGNLQVDEAIVIGGFEPNGYFWEGVLIFAAPAVATSIELDSEAGMFAAYGDVDVLERAQQVLEPLVTNIAEIVDLMAHAAVVGVDLQDPSNVKDDKHTSFFGRLFGRR